jgi:hypothetical protein
MRQTLAFAIPRLVLMAFGTSLAFVPGIKEDSGSRFVESLSDPPGSHNLIMTR